MKRLLLVLLVLPMCGCYSVWASYEFKDVKAQIRKLEHRVDSLQTCIDSLAVKK